MKNLISSLQAILRINLLTILITLLSAGYGWAEVPNMFQTGHTIDPNLLNKNFIYLMSKVEANEVEIEALKKANEVEIEALKKQIKSMARYYVDSDGDGVADPNDCQPGNASFNQIYSGRGCNNCPKGYTLHSKNRTYRVCRGSWHGSDRNVCEYWSDSGRAWHTNGWKGCR